MEKILSDRRCAAATHNIQAYRYKVTELPFNYCVRYVEIGISVFLQHTRICIALCRDPYPPSIWTGKTFVDGQKYQGTGKT